MSRSPITKVIAAAAFLTLAGCGGGPERKPAIGEAFVGPAEVKLRSDIPLDSSTVAVVRHGDRVEVLQQRRQVFLRVRAPNGAEGWTDARQLLSAREMSDLTELSKKARRMPSQGVATTYGELRVHTLPFRRAPTLLTIREGDKVDVVAHSVVPRVEASRPALIPPAPKKARGPKKPARRPKYPPPPLPKPPGPPSNWLEISKTDLSQEEEDPEPAPEAPPVPVDDWSLVRTRSGQAGWALTRSLVMAVPDEVAQYAEGHRIVSYFSLGEVRDGGQTKHHWLWTTLSGGPQAYDFDSFRVFIWSLRRHRYETAYIERNLVGYSPVLLQEVAFAPGPRGAGPAIGQKYPGFSVCVQKAGGQRYRREYAFLTNIVRFAGERPCEAPSPLLAPAGSPAQTAAGQPPPAPAPPTESFVKRFKGRLSAITRKWFGK